jgi:hypothetical protein
MNLLTFMNYGQYYGQCTISIIKKAAILRYIIYNICTNSVSIRLSTDCRYTKAVTVSKDAGWLLCLSESIDRSASARATREASRRDCSSRVSEDALGEMHRSGSARGSKVRKIHEL